MPVTKPQNVDQLIAYLGGHPATESLAEEITQVVCQRRRSTVPVFDGPARPRTTAGPEGPSR